jgi:hypothetical protein
MRLNPTVGPVTGLATAARLASAPPRVTRRVRRPNDTESARSEGLALPVEMRKVLRAAVTVAVALLAALPLAAEAQKAVKVYRIAYLGNSSAALESEFIAAFRAAARVTSPGGARPQLCRGPEYRD